MSSSAPTIRSGAGPRARRFRVPKTNKPDCAERDEQQQEIRGKTIDAPRTAVGRQGVQVSGRAKVTH